jgi:hypothetical protein
VKFDSVPMRAFLISAALAGVAAVAAAMAGNWKAGIALAAGLIIGSGNGLVTARSLDSSVGFQASSLARLGVMSVLALLAASLIGLADAWLVLLGVAAALLVLAGVAAKSLLAK